MRSKKKVKRTGGEEEGKHNKRLTSPSEGDRKVHESALYIRQRFGKPPKKKNP